MNLRKWSGRIAAIFAVVAALSMMFAVPASADIFSGLQAAEDALQTGALTIVTDIVVPIGLTAGIIVLIVLLITLGVKHGRGEDKSKVGWAIAITIAVIIVLSSFYVWGPLMLNTTPSNPV